MANNNKRDQARDVQIIRGLDQMLKPLEGKLSAIHRAYARIAQDYVAGKPVGHIARSNHLTKRTVYRRLKRLERLGDSSSSQSGTGR